MSGPSDKKSRIWLRLLLVAIVLAAVAVAAFYGLRPVAIVEGVEGGPAQDAKPGSVTVVEDYPIELKVDVAGRLLAQDFNLDPGKVVKAAQVLARLDPTDMQLVMDKDKIDFKATKDRFATDHSTELNLEGFRADMKNFERLHDLGHYADVDLAKRERELKIMEEHLKLEKIDHDQVLATFENTLKAEQHKLDEMIILAPVDSVVSAVYRHPGELVGQGEPIATLITIHKEVVGKISEEDFAKIKVGQKASVIFVTYGNNIYSATVSKILPTADPETQRHIIHLDVDIPADKLVAGVNGEVTVVVDSHQARTIVPRRAVFTMGGGENVFVVADGVVRQRPVQVGFVWLQGEEITSGLEPGDRVIVEGLEDFHDGQRVRTRVIPSDAYSSVRSH